MATSAERYQEAADHVKNCPDEKALRDRVGACSECGETVQYGQTLCPHAVLILGTCENHDPPINYDRAGWTNRPETQEA